MAEHDVANEPFGKVPKQEPTKIEPFKKRFPKNKKQRR